MINQLKEMTMNSPEFDARARLEDELDDLDIPILDVVAALEVLGDEFEIDAKVLIQSMFTDLSTYPETPHMDRLRETHGAQGCRVMISILDTALESTTQIPHIVRGIEVNRALLALDA